MKMNLSTQVSTQDNFVSHKSKLNLRGRPSSVNKLNFSPQPNSIVSKLLNRLTNDKGSVINYHQLKQVFKGKDNTLHVHGNDHETSYMKISIDKNTMETNTDYRSDEADNTNCTEFDINTVQCNKYSDMLDNVIMTDPVINVTNKKKEIGCLICSHRSNNPKQHREHLAIHKNDNGYFCNYLDCHYTCKISSNLIKHKRVHTSEKPFICDQCTFRTNFKNSLKVHRRIHTDDRPYMCKYCNYKCNSSSNLKKHCTHRHPESVSM